MDPPLKRLTLPASPGSISAFSEFVRDGAAAAGVATHEFGKLELVLEEILINVARYAYTPETGAVEVTCAQAGPRKIRIEIADFGRVFNPLEADPPDLSHRRPWRLSGAQHGGFHRLPPGTESEHSILYLPYGRRPRQWRMMGASKLFYRPATSFGNVSLYNVSNAKGQPE